MEIYEKYLSKGLDNFNIKSLLSNTENKKIIKNKIFTDYNELNLPDEFVSFLKCYLKFIDPFVIISDYYYIKEQYYIHLLNKSDILIYELLYRKIYDNLTEIKISIVLYYENYIPHYQVIKNYKIGDKINNCYSYTFEDALILFYEKN